MTAATAEADLAPDIDAAAPEMDMPEGLAVPDAARSDGAAASALDDAAASAPVARPAYPLPARMRVAEVEDLLLWLRAAPAGAAVVIDASVVQNLSTPGVLALAAAARACAADGVPVAIDRPAPAFVDAFSDLGLFQDLMKMEFRP